MTVFLIFILKSDDELYNLCVEVCANIETASKWVMEDRFKIQGTEYYHIEEAEVLDEM